MNVAAAPVLKQSPERTAMVALKTFFNVMEKWGVAGREQIILLGQPSRTTFYKWKKGDATSIPCDTLERISYVLGIYKALGVLFPNHQLADAWPKKPNQAFSNESALEYMCKGGMKHLHDMRRYLDAQRG